MDQTGQHSDCEGSTAESEEEYLVSVVIVVHQIPVSIADVREKSSPKCQTLDPRRLAFHGTAAIRGTHGPDSRVVITALTRIDRYAAVELGDVGFLVDMAETVTRSVTTNHYSFGHAYLFRTNT